VRPNVALLLRYREDLGSSLSPETYYPVLSQSLPGLEGREYGRRDPLRLPCGTHYPRKLALTSPTSGGISVGIVRSRTQATESQSLQANAGIGPLNKQRPLPSTTFTICHKVYHLTKSGDSSVGIETAHYPRKLAPTSPTSGGISVGIVRSRTQATESQSLQANAEIGPLNKQRPLPSTTFTICHKVVYNLSFNEKR
jgi:hypothetical protein